MEGAKWINPIKYDKSIYQPNSTCFLSLSLGSTLLISAGRSTPENHLGISSFDYETDEYKGLACCLYSLQGFDSVLKAVLKAPRWPHLCETLHYSDKVHDVLRENVFWRCMWTHLLAMEIWHSFPLKNPTPLTPTLFPAQAHLTLFDSKGTCNNWAFEIHSSSTFPVFVWERRSGCELAHQYEIQIILWCSSQIPWKWEAKQTLDIYVNLFLSNCNEKIFVWI